MAENQHTFSSKTRLGLIMGPEFNSNNEYKGNSVIIDAQCLAEAYRSNEVHLIRIKSKEIVQVKWLDPFFPMELPHG